MYPVLYVFTRIHVLCARYPCSQRVDGEFCERSRLAFGFNTRVPERYVRACTAFVACGQRTRVLYSTEGLRGFLICDSQNGDGEVLVKTLEKNAEGHTPPCHSELKSENIFV